MSWTDKELDELFKDAAEGQSFEYNAAYFKDIEAQLPVNKGRKRGWFWIFGSVALVLFVITALLQLGEKPSNSQYTAQSKEDIDTNVDLDNLDKNNSSEINTGNVLLSNVRSEGDEKTLNGLSVRFDQGPGIKLEEGSAKSTVDADGSATFNDIQDLPDHHSSNIGSLEIEDIKSMTILNPEIIDQAFDKPLFNRSRSRLFIEFAGGMGQSPISSTENGSSRSMSWSISGGYIYSKHKWNLSAGVGVSESYFNNLFIKERSTIYGFGVNTFDNHYQFASIFKLDLPVGLSYRLGSHELSAGLNTSIPLFARVNYVELKDGSENSQGKSFCATSPYFKKVLFEPSIGYRFQMDKDWSIGAKLNAQVINPLGSDRIKGDRNNLPLSGHITLRKTFELK